MNISIADVTPAQAFMWIKSSPGNRRLRDATVKRYASDMQADKWHVGNDAVIIDEKGHLRNAHHRLTALIISGRSSVKMLVRTKVPVAEIASMDQGLTRSVSDGLRFGDSEHFANITARDTGAMRMVLAPYSTAQLSRDLIGEALEEYQDELDFVFNQCFSGLQRSGITAPIFAGFIKAAAFNKEWWEKLNYAGTYLIDVGVAIEEGAVPLEKGTAWIRSLRKHIFEKATRTTGSAPRKEMYNICINTLSQFLAENEHPGTPSISKSLKTRPQNDPFPLRKSYLERINNYAPKVDYLIYLREVAKTCYNGQELSPVDIAQSMIEMGAKVKAMDPAKSLSIWFAKAVKHAGQLELSGLGVFAPVNPDKKRIKKYRFSTI